MFSFLDFLDNRDTEGKKHGFFQAEQPAWVLKYFFRDVDSGKRTGGRWELKVWILSEIKLIALLRKLGLSRICCKDQNKSIVFYIGLHKEQIFDVDLGLRNHICT